MWFIWFNDDIIDTIPIIIIILFLIVISSNTFVTSLFFFQHNRVVSLSLLLIVFFCLSLFPPSRGVWSLIRITEYIGSACMGNHTLSIYQVCFSTSTMVSYHHQYFPFFLSFFVVFSPHMSVTTCWDHWLRWK